MARVLALTLNGRRRTDAVPDNLLLLDYLREVAGLTGTKTGCDGGECGACTVLVDDEPQLSCLTLAITIDGRRVDTVEALGTDGRLSAVQRGFHEKLGSQCGYCTPGFIMASAGLLRRNPRPTERRHPRRARQQHLPLHRLCEDHRGGAVRRRTARARGPAVIAMWRTYVAAGTVHPPLEGEGRERSERGGVTARADEILTPPRPPSVASLRPAVDPPPPGEGEEWRGRSMWP